VSNTLLELIGREIGRFLAPLGSLADDPAQLDELMASVGLATPDAERDALLTSLIAIATLKPQVDALLAQPSLSISDISAVLDISRKAFTALQALNGAAGSSAELASFGQDLADRLISNYLFNWHPLLRSVAALIAIQELAEDIEPNAPVVQNGELVRGSFSVDRFHFDRLISLLRDPAAALRGEYASALVTSDDADALADKLFPRVQRVLRELGVTCRYGFDPDDRPLLGDAAAFLDHALIVYADDILAGAAAEAGIVFTISAADRGDLGLVSGPFGALTSTRQAGRFAIEMNLTADVDVVAYGRHGLTLLASDATAEVAGGISATLVRRDDKPGFIFGTPNSTRIEVGGARLSIDTSLSEARQSLALSADVSSSAIVIAPGDSDSFLSSFLPADGLRAKFDLGLTWSNEHGLTLRGAAGLDATLPVGISLGGTLTVPTIHLGLQAADAALVAEVSASIGVSIGPIQALVDRVGITSAVSFPASGGNIGVANLDLGFKPPTGVGLAIDASVVVGGGFLRFDPQQQEYSGILELQIAETIAVKAIGLLTTRLPGGGKGYSLVVIIFAEGFEPIQLGLGFTLTGIGGLLGINRTFDEATLRAGLKNHTLDSILFPQDPIRNAPQILSNLNKVFPPSNGHHLFGPMAQLAWGTPTLITADLALVLEFGARLRLLILAQVLAVLPTRDNDLLRLQMDAVGVIDFDQATAALDATLHDSRLLNKFVLTGDMAMRLKWQSSPNFALAVGGLHPAFNPPANFPKLERIAINLATGDNPRIRCESYFALTSNTVQFGARADLYAAAADFSIHGEIGYDVLLQVDPFAFIADFFAQLQLKHGSTNLFKVKVEGELAGPRPLHIKAKATFEILWWDVSIHIDKTLVEGALPPQLAPVDVLPRLKAALRDPGNWRDQLPNGQRPMVTLRATAGAAAAVALHPLGTLTVKQAIVPLGMEISRFGQATPAGAHLFTISSVSLGEQSQMTDPVRDFFAPAQFFELSDDEKLSRPSFESMTAGISFGSDAFAFTDNSDDWLEVPAIEFDTIIVDKQANSSRPSGEKDPYQLSTAHLGNQARFGAAGTSDLRRTGSAKYRTTAGKYRVVKEGWSIIATDSLAPQPALGIRPGAPASYSEAAQALRALEQADPTKAGALKIVRLSEVAD
jgi:hypothetical protein